MVVLSGHKTSSQNDSDLALPSWCPDWRTYDHAGTSPYKLFHKDFFLVGYQNPDKHGRLDLEGVAVAVLADPQPKLFPKKSLCFGRLVSTMSTAATKDGEVGSAKEYLCDWSDFNIEGSLDDSTSPKMVIKSLVPEPSLFHGYRLVNPKIIQIMSNVDSSECKPGDLLVRPFYDARVRLDTFSLTKEGNRGLVLMPRQPEGYLFLGIFDICTVSLFVDFEVDRDPSKWFIENTYDQEEWMQHFTIY